MVSRLHYKQESGVRFPHWVLMDKNSIEFTNEDVDFVVKHFALMVTKMLTVGHNKEDGKLFAVTPPKEYSKYPTRTKKWIDKKWWVKTIGFEGVLTGRQLLVLVMLTIQIRQLTDNGKKRVENLNPNIPPTMKLSDAAILIERALDLEDVK